MSIFGVTFPFFYAGADPLPILCLVVAGAGLCLYGGLVLVTAVATRSGHAPGLLGSLAGYEIADELGNSILLGVGCGLLGGIAFELVQARTSIAFEVAYAHGGSLSFVFPPALAPGLLLGVELGILAGALAGRIPSFPRTIAIGLGAGVAGGLVLFRLHFGPSAGYAPIVGVGMGAEVSRAYGVLGGLLGAFLATLLSGALVRSRNWWHTFLIGIGVGALTGVVLALLGILTNQFVLMPQLQRGFGGVGLFVAGGGVLGGVAGGLAAQQRRETAGATPASRPRPPDWLVVTPGIFLGLLGGLAVGLTYRYAGGYLFSPPQNPQAGMLGLLLGGVTGLLAGVGIAVLWNRAGRPVSDREKARASAGAGAGIALILLGAVVLTLPFWFTPLVGLNIACVWCH